MVTSSLKFVEGQRTRWVLESDGSHQLLGKVALGSVAAVTEVRKPRPTPGNGWPSAWFIHSFLFYLEERICFVSLYQKTDKADLFLSPGYFKSPVFVVRQPEEHCAPWNSHRTITGTHLVNGITLF